MHMTVDLKENQVSRAQETKEVIVAVAAKGDDREDNKTHIKVQMELGVLIFASTKVLLSHAALCNSMSECVEKWAIIVMTWIIPAHLEHYTANSHLLG